MNEGHHHRQRRPVQRAPAGARLALLAAAALTLGVLVYMLDRPAGSAAGLPALLEAGRSGTPPLFGALGGNLPSFAHAFAFSLLSCLVLPRRLAPMAAACAFWAFVDAGFEVLQQPALAQPVVAALHQTAIDWPGREALAAYLAHGRFDPLDLLASSLGAMLAFGLAARAIRRPADPPPTDPQHVAMTRKTPP